MLRYEATWNGARGYAWGLGINYACCRYMRVCVLAAVRVYREFTGYGCEQATAVCRVRLKEIITLPRRAANAYGSYSANGSLQAMVVSRGWVLAG